MATQLPSGASTDLGAPIPVAEEGDAKADIIAGFEEAKAKIEETFDRLLEVVPELGCVDPTRRTARQPVTRLSRLGHRGIAASASRAPPSTTARAYRPAAAATASTTAAIGAGRTFW